jgi:hypothetical protein
MIQLIKKAINKYHREGLFPLLNSIPPYLYGRIIRRFYVRLLDPKPIKCSTAAGIKVPTRGKRYLLDSLVNYDDVSDDEFEGGLVTFHKEFTQSGDRVSIVGGGFAITTVTAINQSEEGGVVRVYEPSTDRINAIAKTVTANGIAQWGGELSHTVVGNLSPQEELNREGLMETVPALEPSALPECDVLELDCEGAEVNILKNLDIRPRMIFVEVHPKKLTMDATEVSRHLKQNGYCIISYRTHNGDKISEDTYKNLIKSSYFTERNIIDKETPTKIKNRFSLPLNKQITPPVLCATYKEEN